MSIAPPICETLEPRRLLSATYSITTLINAQGARETRFYYQGKQHFLSLIQQNGSLAIRPHPGIDVNGWGSTLYLQPFLPGATLKGTQMKTPIVGKNSIEVKASGTISRNTAATYGVWSADVVFQYNPTAKRVVGTGTYSMNLQGALSASTGDLNVCKIASNYLHNVPLRNGTTGDTGDMQIANVVEDSKTFSWTPPAQPSFFPQDLTNRLSIDVVGQRNIVDTGAQGYQRIKIAYKPSLKLVLTGPSMIFGGIYNTAESQQYWSDNVGITPLVLHTATQTHFTFSTTFVSTALPGG